VKGPGVHHEYAGLSCFGFVWESESYGKGLRLCFNAGTLPMSDAILCLTWQTTSVGPGRPGLHGASSGTRCRKVPQFLTRNCKKVAIDEVTVLRPKVTRALAEL